MWTGYFKPASKPLIGAALTADEVGGGIARALHSTRLGNLAFPRPVYTSHAGDMRAKRAAVILHFDFSSWASIHK